MKRPASQQIQDARDGAARARRELARGEREPLEDFPGGPPKGDSDSMEAYLATFREWHEAHVGPISRAEWHRVRAEHGLDT